MFKLLVAVVAIALADSVNPSLIGAELFLATGPNPRRRTAAFTLAASAVTLVVGLALALGLGDLILSFLPKPGPKVKYELIAGAGLVLIVGGAVVWFRRHSLVASEPEQDQDQPRQHGSAMLLGAGIAGVELLTAFPYFAAIAMIVGSSVSNAGKVSLLVVYCFVYMLPLIVIAIAIAVLGTRAEHILGPVGIWLSAHWPVIVGPMTAAFGVGVMVYGLVGLSSS